MSYDTITAVKRANRAAGQHFFDASNLRFFNSRILPTVYGGRYFITSEQFVPSWPNAPYPRRYTVREALADGRIDTVGEFQRYASASVARTAARTLAAD